MQTTIHIDFGVIVAALAPTIAIIVAAILAKRDAKIAHKQGQDIHTLVNDQMTREKAERLAVLKAQLLLLRRFSSESDESDEDVILIASLEEQIKLLAREIADRDFMAVSISLRDG